MPHFSHNGVSLFYKETGEGMPFVFQHGLGADVNQPFGLFKPPAGVRLICMDARGHGSSELGQPEQIAIGTFADDLAALLHHLEISRAVVGGISMGAAIALNFALRYPARVMGLVLSRAAWLDGPNPFNVKMFGLVSQLIHSAGPLEGLVLFQASSEYAELLREFPDTAASLSNQFRHPRAREMAMNLNRIPNDAPIRDLNVLSQISAPTLILANRRDPIHPFEYGARLAEEIDNAQFREIPSKSDDLQGHLRQTQNEIEEFLTEQFLKTPAVC
jgi:pimeloyl-ACP methyl ester carboxylesterase